ncbi:hypothetical protein DPMN_150634 [Dreissena polymorpha]|uniref:Uncharacterized protein n=1 Tax=Dreissena polymorpha TaxID=45954 RepID=A0A9D4J5S9_DREPO|nr:hypothetical protein DPMN_150634 [Dreissena polymorpha]
MNPGWDIVTNQRTYRLLLRVTDSCLEHSHKSVLVQTLLLRMTPVWNIVTNQCKYRLSYCE